MPSAAAPANPAMMLPLPMRLTFTEVDLNMVDSPNVACPSPAMATVPFLRTQSMVVMLFLSLFSVLLFLFRMSGRKMQGLSCLL